MSIPRYWREIKYRYRLIGSVCENCGSVLFPRKNICIRCGSRELGEMNLSEKGRVVSYTVVRNPPKEYEKYAPYIVALIELEDGVRILSQVVDCDLAEMQIGMEVEMTFRRIREDGSSGIIEYGYKFRPVIGE